MSDWSDEQTATPLDDVEALLEQIGSQQAEPLFVTTREHRRRVAEYVKEHDEMPTWAYDVGYWTWA